MRVWAFAVCTFALAACGRLGFDGGGSATDANRDTANGDTPQANQFCNRSPVAADPLTITGHVFRYLNFDGNIEGLAGDVSASPAPGAQAIASTTAQTDGSYQLSLTTGGRPQPLWLDVTLPAYFETKYWFDYPVEHPIVGPFTPQIRPGDVPLWAAGALDSIYSSDSVVRDDVGHGTLVVTVVDCDEQPVPDVTISVDPPLGTPTYLGADGYFDDTATATIGPYAQAVFLNESPGNVTVHATHATHAFLPFDVSVSTGSAVSIVIIHTADPE